MFQNLLPKITEVVDKIKNFDKLIVALSGTSTGTVITWIFAPANIDWPIQCILFLGVFVVLMLSICVCWKPVSWKKFLVSPAVCVMLFSKQFTFTALKCVN